MKITHDPGSEVATLAAAMRSVSARKLAKRYIEGADFYDPAHEALWDAMVALDREGIVVEEMALQGRVASNPRAREALIAVTLNHAIPDNVDAYAETVRDWAARRRIYSEAVRAQQSAENPEVDANGLASAVAARFAAVRDQGAADEVKSITLAELLAGEDDEPDWVIPGLLERRDRFMLTGGEGLGKSYLLRQIAICAAGGLDPFDMRPIDPKRALIVDCENSMRQVKRKARGIVEFAQRNGTGKPGGVHLLCTGRIDILRDKDLSMIHREVDAVRPDIIVIGPIYAMSPKALMTDDDAVPVLAALDTLREGGAALLMEAHAGHAAGPDGRNFRPRGSAALMGWPEFGYGMKPVANGYADLVPWRGDRDARRWPTSLKHDYDGIRWIEHDGRGFTQERAAWAPSAPETWGATA